MIDALEGNPEAIAVRERYRDIVKALGADTDRFVARFEIKLTGSQECVIVATSSQGRECDENLCKLAIAMIATLSNVRVDSGDVTET